MQPTKYPLQAHSGASGGVFCTSEGSAYAVGSECPKGMSPPAGAPFGAEGPIDLIEEHLTYNFHQTEYRQGAQGGRLVKNWYFPEDWRGCAAGDPTFVLKVQPFAKGGYEASVRGVDLEKIGNAMLNGGKRGKREAPDVVSIENQMKAAARSKRKMRHLVKNMMADHLVTFTKHEGPSTKTWGDREWAAWECGGKDAWEAQHGAFMGPDDWAKVWDKFRRLLTRYLGEFPYVAILEEHQKGNFHLHVAWCGRVNVGLVRKMWLAALGGGKGCGNIDAKKIKVPAGGDRASRIARYISKYVAKHFEDAPRYNKKRYWASRQTLEEARRYVLTADSLDGAVEQMRQMLGLDFAKFWVMGARGLKMENMFSFPDGCGLWLAYIPEIHGSDPPF